MAWRIDEQLIRGEIDNRTRGRVTGKLWFIGRKEPVVLELEGNAWRDVAGHALRFTNPAPKASEREGGLDGFAGEQRGVVGDITASRKVKVPECSMEELMEYLEARKPFPWHWGNSLYLEWHSERNGRVVIESASYRIEIDGEAAWTMSEAEEEEQRAANGRAMIAFMERLTGAMDLSEVQIVDLSEAEVDGDEEPEAGEGERGEGVEAEGRAHALVARCAELHTRWGADCRERAWLSAGASLEHPLCELVNGVRSAGVRLAGALESLAGEEAWPPEARLAADVLAGLQKAHGHLCDALAGADAAAEEVIADAAWLAVARAEVVKLIAEVERLIAEVRAVLEAEGEDGAA